MEDAERYTISNAGVDQLWEFRVKSKNAQGNGPECLIQRARTAKKGTRTTDVKIQPRYLTDCSTELITKTRERESSSKYSIFLNICSTTIRATVPEIQGSRCRLCGTRVDNGGYVGNRGIPGNI